jgi:hypothetical protein
MYCVQIESWKCKGRELEAAKVQLKDLEAKVAQLQLVVSIHPGSLHCKQFSIYVFPKQI